ncbi:site-specific integrase [Pseudolactococcus piscium]|nr:hypothetical protein [Lactococcus piscium]
MNHTKEQLRTFFEYLESHTEDSSRTSTKILTFLRILAFTDMRKSEVLALQWKDIDIFNQNLTIGKTLAMKEYNQIIIQEPKTISSQRKIAPGTKTIKFLEQWRYNQKNGILSLAIILLKNHNFFLLINLMNYITHKLRMTGFIAS